MAGDPDCTEGVLVCTEEVAQMNPEVVHSVPLEVVQGTPPGVVGDKLPFAIVGDTGACAGGCPTCGCCSGYAGPTYGGVFPCSGGAGEDI